MLVAIVFGADLTLVGCSDAFLRWEPDTYTVRNGDTLYGIAWRYGLDYRDLAHWNRLNDQNLIYPGQTLMLQNPGGVKSTSGTTSASSGSSSGSRASRGSSGSSGSSGASGPAAPSRAAEPAPGFEWPTKGPVVAGFGATDSVGSGIDISGSAGQPVVAAAGGRVVYSGSGLIGYGQLIIVKHNNTFLSAYGYNSSLSVRQGDTVRKGQRIAQMGEGPGRRPMLHFEIRLNGQPVNPLSYLTDR